MLEHAFYIYSRALADIVGPLIISGVIVHGRAFYTGQVLYMGHNKGEGNHLTVMYIFQAKDNAAAKDTVRKLDAFNAFLVKN